MTVEVRETLAGEVLLWHQGQAIALQITEKPKRKEAPIKKASSAAPRKPAKGHPWRNTNNQPNAKRTTKKDSFQEAIYSQQNSYVDALVRGLDKY